MKKLEDAILERGKVLPGNILKVDSFLNHQIDVGLLNDIGREFYKTFKDDGVEKILTIEASGIGIACIAAQYFNVPVVFAKKSKTKNISDDFYSCDVASFTHGNVNRVVVSKEYLKPGERILAIDDFLAEGEALMGLRNIILQAGAVMAGAGIVIEKGFEPGGRKIRELGIKLRSLAVIESMSDCSIKFAKTE